MFEVFFFFPEVFSSINNNNRSREEKLLQTLVAHGTKNQECNRHRESVDHPSSSVAPRDVTTYAKIK